MTERLRVLAIVPYATGIAPGQRYRIEQWAPYLLEAGIDVHFESFASRNLVHLLYEQGQHFAKAARMSWSWLKFVPRISQASDYDAVVLHREAALLGPAILERLARWRNPRLVYDFDDAIWLRYISPRNSYFSYLKFPGKTRTICRLASAITVGNEYLAQFARRYNSHVLVVPSTVSLREYRCPPPSRSRSDPVIGWTGSHSSIQYLRLVEGALQQLARRRQFRLRLVGVDGFSIRGVNVECQPWRPETEVEDLWQFDVGIMPLSEDPWTAGKCSMKAVQYLGAGVPAVVSPIGANVDLVQDGVNGLHARNEEEWLNALETCLDDVGLRERLARAGRKVVAERYSAEAQAPRVASLIRSLLE